MSSERVLFNEFDLLRKDLIAAYEAKGMRASGQFERELEIKTSFDSVLLLGMPYGQQLETGRRSGKFPPIEAIEQWIEDKGIQAIDISVSSLAFLIARKIAREGWNREGYGGVELLSEVITDKRIQDILDKFGIVKSKEIVSDIIRLTKETLN